MVDYETRVRRASQLSGCTNNAEVESVFDSRIVGYSENDRDGGARHERTPFLAINPLPISYAPEVGFGEITLQTFRRIGFGPVHDLSIKTGAAAAYRLV
jgi:hypothetical protein